jgi:hypothetical protein
MFDAVRVQYGREAGIEDFPGRRLYKDGKPGGVLVKLGSERLMVLVSVQDDFRPYVAEEPEAEALAELQEERRALAAGVLRNRVDPTLDQMIESLLAAASDPAVKLIRLCEVAEALAERFGPRNTKSGRRRAAKALVIPIERWERLEELCNDRSPGRHEGRKHLAPRPATAEELGEAEQLAMEMFRAYEAYLRRSWETTS